MSDAQTHVPVVLVVEDEFLIRFDTAESIREAGFKVLEAASADEAVVILESRDDVRVVFTEIVMPGSRDGLRLARAVRERWPHVSIVATSADLFKPNDLPAGSIFLPKPYNPAMLGGTLRALAGP